MAAVVILRSLVLRQTPETRFRRARESDRLRPES